MGRLYRKFGGVFLNEASWDFENRLNGVLYSEQISRALKGEVSSTPNTKVTAVTRSDSDSTRPARKPKIKTINGRPVVSVMRGKNLFVEEICVKQNPNSYTINCLLYTSPSPRDS